MQIMRPWLKTENCAFSRFSCFRPNCARAFSASGSVLADILRSVNSPNRNLWVGQLGAALRSLRPFPCDLRRVSLRGCRSSRSRLAALCEPHSASCGPYKESPDEWRRQGLSEEGRHRRGAGCPKAGRCASRRWYSKAARCRLVAQLSGCAVEALCLMPTRCRFWDPRLIDLFGQFKYNRFWRGHGGTFSRAILRGSGPPVVCSMRTLPGAVFGHFRKLENIAIFALHAEIAL